MRMTVAFQSNSDWKGVEEKSGAPHLGSRSPGNQESERER